VRREKKGTSGGMSRERDHAAVDRHFADAEKTEENLFYEEILLVNDTD